MSASLLKWFSGAADSMLVAAALAPIFLVVGYGVIVSSESPSDVREPSVIGALRKPDFVLTYADPQKALFRSRGGVVTVMLGGILEPFGRVVSIAMENGHWTVRTVEGVTFVRN